MEAGVSQTRDTKHLSSGRMKGGHRDATRRDGLAHRAGALLPGLTQEICSRRKEHT